MLRIRDLILPETHDVSELYYHAAQALHVRASDIAALHIFRRSLSSRRFAPPYGSEKAGSKRNSESRHEERSCVPGMDNRPFAAAGAGFLQYKFGGLGHQICHCKAPKGTR